MYPINIYELTRVKKNDSLQRYEKLLSGRGRFLNLKTWEINGLELLFEHCKECMEEAYNLSFYYSFQIPRLGKEFDLLRISKDYVVNIELKSKAVPDESIKKQLKQNRYYLALLEKNIRSYTFISEDERLLRLTNSGNLVETTFEELANDLKRQEELYTGNIEDLFKEEDYLLSPLTHPDRFLLQEYFLTSQQRDIRNHIINRIKKKNVLFQGFTGLPGTGKTLLLYDIAMGLSWKQKVCVLHYGSFPMELEILDKRLKRIDFYDCGDLEELPDIHEYSCILVDEGHRIPKRVLDILCKYVTDNNCPVVFSYDSENAISPLENILSTSDEIEKIPGYIKYRMTNRIRTNSELSSFIRQVMNNTDYSHRRSFPSVFISYAGNKDEARVLINKYCARDYIYISDKTTYVDGITGTSIDTSDATCKEFDKVVMFMDRDFKYDDDGYLRYTNESEMVYESPVRNMFHGLGRAKKSVAIVVLDNEKLFDYLLSIIQP